MPGGLKSSDSLATLWAAVPVPPAVERSGRRLQIPDCGGINRARAAARFHTYVVIGWHMKNTAAVS